MAAAAQSPPSATTRTPPWRAYDGVSRQEPQSHRLTQQRMVVSRGAFHGALDLDLGIGAGVQVFKDFQALLILAVASISSNTRPGCWILLQSARSETREGRVREVPCTGYLDKGYVPARLRIAIAAIGSSSVLLVDLQYAMSREEEKQFLIQAAGMVEEVTGQRPIGYNCNWLRRGPYEEAGTRRRMMSVSAHDRISGSPQIVKVWDEFLNFSRREVKAGRHLSRGWKVQRATIAVCCAWKGPRGKGSADDMFDVPSFNMLLDPVQDDSAIWAFCSFDKLPVKAQCASFFWLALPEASK